MSRLLVFFLSVYSFSAMAVSKPVPTGATGVSAQNLTGTPTFWGGIAGGDCGADQYSVCDSCTPAYASACGANAPYCPCNQSRIFNNLVAQITVNPVANSRDLKAVYTPANTTTQTDLNYVSTSTTTIGLRWSDICFAMGATSDCSSLPANTNTLSVKLYFDANGDNDPNEGEEVQEIKFVVLNPPSSYEVVGQASNSGEGFTYFRPYPGDEKVYIERTQAPIGFPNLGYGTKVVGMRVFISETSMDDANVNSPLAFGEISVVDDGGGISPKYVDGLENEKPYYFRIASMDEAGNLIQYYPDNATLPAACTTAPDPTQCEFAATPSEVLGLLSEDFNCFVATAAYGTSLEPKLNTFREFRYKILIQNKWGLEFTKLYYKYGPYAARYISDKPVLRGVARALLWPLYGFSYLALKMGFAFAFAAALLLLSSLIALPWLGAKTVLRRG